MYSQSYITRAWLYFYIKIWFKYVHVSYFTTVGKKYSLTVIYALYLYVYNYSSSSVI